MSGTATMPVQRPVPDQLDSARIVDWDYINDPKLKSDPHAVYGSWVATGLDVVWTTANGGHWILLNNEAIVEALQTPELFSSVHTQIPPRPGAAKLIPEELDPPEHTKYRAQLNKKLGPKMIKYFEERASVMSKELIDKVEADGEVDLMKALTIPLPCALFLDLVGLPSSRTDEFVEWKNDLFKGATVEIQMGAQLRINALLEGVLAEKRASGQTDDLIGYLVNEARIDDAPITHADLMAYCFLFFIAGLDTVTSTMTNCFHYIATHPGVQKRLVDDPKSIFDFIEEVLRRYSVVNMTRTATRDFEWRGVKIRKDDQFVAGSTFANLDAREFGEPMKFDPDRESNRHIGFGAGPHRCAGSHLARIELIATLKEVLPRLKNLRMQPNTHLEFDAGGLVGLTSLPVEWDV